MVGTGAVLMAEDRALTVPEVAERLSLAEWTVRQWLRVGKLRGYQIGGRRAGWRVDESDLQAFLDEAKRSRANITEV
jgi:excisionase family DNA binding protein